MSESNLPPSGDQFQPYDSTVAATQDLEFEGTNVCRAAALAMFARAGGRDYAELAGELKSLGFGRPPGVYAEQLQFGRAASTGFDSLATVAGQEAQDEVRVSAWSGFSESGDVGSAWTYLAALLGSGLERESAAAAAAVYTVLAPVVDRFDTIPTWWLLSEDGSYAETAPDEKLDDRDRDRDRGSLAWSGEAWRSISEDLLSTDLGVDRRSTLLLVARLRLQWGSRSTDRVTRELAHAAMVRPERSLGDPSGPAVPGRVHEGGLVVSTMVHGTWGWKGGWWRPAGDFHAMVLAKHRPNLYSRGARFSWSGALRHRHRVVAGQDLHDWIQEVAPHGLQTVFAHSYGGEVVARAARHGSRVHEAVMLSVPADPCVTGLAQSPLTRLVDVRTPFDPVLALAGDGQRIPGVEPVLLPWYLGHSASHSASVWEDNDVAVRAGI